MGEDSTNTLNGGDRTIRVGTPQSGAGANRKAYLVVLAGWEIGREIELAGGEFLFGRSLKAAIRINSPSVSREHAKITCCGDHGDPCYVVTDLMSNNGTMVNNVPVESARLHNGDKISMGDVLFKFVLADEADARFYKDIHRLIHFDQLTGLMTMDAFRRRLEFEMQRTDGMFTLAMTDLDGLKKVNDTYGHLAGRMVIREMGAIIRQCLRQQDIAALYGGDETAIMFCEVSAEDAVGFAENIRHTLEAHVFEYKEHKFHVTISQGLAQWPKDGSTMDELIAAADTALYAAKAAGRNCVRVCGQ
jgi:diguanylate cyclase (GGDEF)-like protein